VLGIQSRAIDDPSIEYDSVSSMAEAYSELICGRQHSGPYCLLGWSTGGIYAWAVAHALEAAGKRIEHLILVDSYLPCDADRLQSDAEFAREMLKSVAAAAGIPFSDTPRKGLGQSIAASAAKSLYADFLALPPEERRVYSRKFRESLFRHFPGLPRERVSRQLDLVARHDSWAREFEPAVPDCRISVLRAQKQVRGIVTAWEAHCKGRTEIHGVPGDHFSILLPPRAAETAALARSILAMHE
jgi:thioesterase domain-containing protein